MNNIDKANQQSHQDKPLFDDWLSRELDADESHLDDGGFSDRVMSALPARSSKFSTSQWPVYIAVILSSMLVAWLFPSDELLRSLLSVSVSLLQLLLAGALFTFSSCVWAFFKIK